MSVFEAAQEAHRALCELEDALDARIGHVGNEPESVQLRLVVNRWEHDTLHKIHRQLEASRT